MKMIKYLIRTDENEKRTHIFQLGNSRHPGARLGVIYTDFLAYDGMRDIINEEIIDYKTKKPIARIKINSENDIVSIVSNKMFGNKKISSFSKQGEYMENGIIIPCRKVAKAVLLATPEYKKLEEIGISHAYFLDDKNDKSSLSSVFCFQRGKDISGIVYPKDSDTNTDIQTALKGLALVLAQRISEQEYIFEFIRK